jgi:hypothetical protein
LVGCGDDDGGGDTVSDSDCALGITLSGDVEKSVSVNDSAACLVAHSFESGIIAGLTVLGSGFSIQINVQDVTEGQTGSGFPMEVGVNIDDGPGYNTPLPGCSASITEHAFNGTVENEIGEQREYRVIGSASCTEQAVREDAPGELTLTNVVFHIPGIWTD